jgi:hypothetical protein
MNFSNKPLISHKEHLTPEGLRKLVAIKASMNQGLSDELKASFHLLMLFRLKDL